MSLSVYVDDSLISGPSLKECKEEMEAILDHFKGTVVPPTKIHPDGTEERDLLGSTLLFNRSKRFMKIHMKAYIQKMLERFNMEGCRSVSSPCAPYADLSLGKTDEKFPMRQLMLVLSHLTILA